MKKLQLNKQIIAQLDKREIEKVKGGVSTVCISGLLGQTMGDKTCLIADSCLDCPLCYKAM